MVQPDRPDRFLETEKDIPITKGPAHPDRSVRGKPTKAPRPDRPAD